MSATSDPVVSGKTPMAPDYYFVAKGNPYVTKNCRAKTYQASQTVYVVKDKKGNTTGIRVPRTVHRQVIEDERTTRNTRKEAVDKKDEGDKKKFEDEVLKTYPNIPKDVIPVLADWTLTKRKGRVGRTTTMNQANKVRLAANAHVRHRYTQYDQMLKNGVGRGKARDTIMPEQRRVLEQWKGGPEPLDTAKGDNNRISKHKNKNRNRNYANKNKRKDDNNNKKSAKPSRKDRKIKKDNVASKLISNQDVVTNVPPKVAASNPTSISSSSKTYQLRTRQIARSEPPIDLVSESDDDSELDEHSDGSLSQFGCSEVEDDYDLE